MASSTFARGFEAIGAAALGVALLASAVAAQDVITVRPKLSLLNAEFENIRNIVEDAASKLVIDPTTSLTNPSDVQVLVKKGDTLSAIVERQWGPEIKAAGVNYPALIDTLRKDPANKPIADRSTTGLLMQPGDTLHLPRVIAGRRKTGTIVVELPAQPSDPLAAQVATVTLAAKLNDAVTEKTATQTIVPAAAPAAPNAPTNPPVAVLSDIETCASADARAPFDYRRLVDQLALVAPRQKNIKPAGGQIAVIDSSVNGSTDPLMPFMYKLANAVGAPDEGYGYNVPSQNGRLVSLVSTAASPRKHGTHIISLAFGGADWLSAPAQQAGTPLAKWQLVPIVVQNETGNGPSTIQPFHVDLAVNYARGRHVKIVNMSIEAQGTGFLGQIADTGERNERLYVVAAGNGQLSFNYQPAVNLTLIRNDEEKYWIIPAMRGGFNRSNVVTVAAYDYLKDEFPNFSGFSEMLVDLAAPGRCVQGFTQLKSDFATSETGGISGTSQATAVVTFAASLVADILGGDAEWAPREVKTRLLASSVYDGRLNKKVASRGHLSIERAIAARYDILRYRIDDGPDKDKIVDVYGDLGDFPGNAPNSINNFQICARDWPYTIRQVLKIVRRGTTKDDTFFDFVPAKIVGPTDALTSTTDPFLWKWEECPANWASLNAIRFNPVKGQPIDVKLPQVIEIIPRHRGT